MSTERSTANDPCGVDDLDPRRPDNRPGLDEIVYRIGTHSAFLRRMMWRIPRQGVPGPSPGTTLRPLRGLTARETSDPSIGLMDAWAAALDVLSFYSERIANEGYLPTAAERASMVELARTIGYELAPGAAASVHLAFTVEDADDPYRAVDVPTGTQAASVPQKKGDLPQVYETTEKILARAEWNAIKARTEEPQHLALHWTTDADPHDRNGKLFLFDLDNSFDLDDLYDQINTGQLQQNDLIEIDQNQVADLAPFHPLAADLDLPQALADLVEDQKANSQIDTTLRAIEVNEVYLRGLATGLSVGDRLLAVGARRDANKDQVVAARPFRVVEAETDRDYDLTRVLVNPVEATKPPAKRRRPPKLRTAQLRIGAVTNTPVVFNAISVNQQVKRTAWTGATFGAFVKVQAWPRLQLMRLIRQPDPVVAPAIGEAVPGFHALRQRAGFFGNSAPRRETLTDAPATPDPYEHSWDRPPPTNLPPPRTIWSDSQGKVPTEAQAYLEREIEEIAPEQWAVLEDPAGNTLALRVASAAGASLADFAVNGKATGLTFRTMDDKQLTIPTQSDGTINLTALDAELKRYTFRTARAFLQSEHLPSAGAPIREDLDDGSTELALDSLYLDLEPGRSISVSGRRADAPGVDESETLEIDDVLHIGGVTRILFNDGPQFSYRRSTVRVNANLALATHGESHSEQLGSGDASEPNQAFVLAKTPLTHVSAKTESGIETTLTVRVDGVKWAEVPSLLDAASTAEVYQVRIDDDGTTRVTFGDGHHGRRLPTGRLNVTAEYRAGIGTVGEATDESIIQLKTRPLGIRGVVNPSPATGSAQPETLAGARRKAPQSVRTLGRIVSLTDYEDFARGFAGIGKAIATAVWFGSEQVAHLTVTPTTDTVFESSATKLKDLRDAVAAFRNQTHRAYVAPHVRRVFELDALLTYDRRYLEAKVDAAARAALSAHFGFAARELGRPVSAAEVIAVLQGVEGVLAVDLDALAIYEPPGPGATSTTSASASGATTTTVPALLRARTARLGTDPKTGADVIEPAELLTLLDAGVELRLEAADE